MVRLTEKQAKLFQDKNFGAVATIRPDGTPHVTPVWVDYDGEHVLFNTATGNPKCQSHRPGERRVIVRITPERVS
jgi:hypothetical protein